jgi:uncharacterized protein (TIGR03084 family)
MPDLPEMLADLDAESAELDALVAERPEVDWARYTPAEGWTVAHTIAHLAWTDRMAYLSAAEPDAFAGELATALQDPVGFVDRTAEAGIAPAPEMLAAWRAGRARLSTALAAADPSTKLPWYGVQMSPVSMATGRIMETWAHGQDVFDALGVTRRPTDRLRHVVHLATRTFAFSFAAHGRPAPEHPVRLELAAPNGTAWTYGNPSATDVVTGSALDFCLVATHRRHRADVDLVATGATADAWLDVIQTFAGPPGDPRAPLAATP